jgi:hypothetical protein
MRKPDRKTLLISALGGAFYLVAMFYGVQGHVLGASAGSAATLVALSGLMWRT